VTLSEDELGELEPRLSAAEVASFGEMDNPDNLDVLLELGTSAALRKIHGHHFRSIFDQMQVR
jgi:hypothetical protein